MKWNVGGGAGFNSFAVTVNAKSALALAHDEMQIHLTDQIKSEIGGNEQEIISLNKKFSDESFYLTGLPVWISSYKSGSKVFNISVDGVTGFVSGERPWSIIKLTIAFFSFLIVAIIIFFMQEESNTIPELIKMLNLIY